MSKENNIFETITNKTARTRSSTSRLRGRKICFLLHCSWFSAAVVVGLGKDDDLGWNTPFKNNIYHTPERPPGTKAWKANFSHVQQTLLLNTDNTRHRLLVNTAQNYCLSILKTYIAQSLIHLWAKSRQEHKATVSKQEEHELCSLRQHQL